MFKVKCTVKIEKYNNQIQNIAKQENHKPIGFVVSALPKEEDDELYETEEKEYEH